LLHNGSTTRQLANMPSSPVVTPLDYLQQPPW
jgi:hypothetical protein